MFTALMHFVLVVLVVYQIHSPVQPIHYMCYCMHFVKPFWASKSPPSFVCYCGGECIFERHDDAQILLRKTRVVRYCRIILLLDNIGNDMTRILI